MAAATAGAALTACRLSHSRGHKHPRENRGEPWQQERGRKEQEQHARMQRAQTDETGADTSQQTQSARQQQGMRCTSQIISCHALHMGRARVSYYIADQGSAE